MDVSSGSSSSSDASAHESSEEETASDEDTVAVVSSIMETSAEAAAVQALQSLMAGDVRIQSPVEDVLVICEHNLCCFLKAPTLSAKRKRSGATSSFTDEVRTDVLPSLNIKVFVLMCAKNAACKQAEGQF